MAQQLLEEGAGVVADPWCSSTCLAETEEQGILMTACNAKWAPLYKTEIKRENLTEKLEFELNASAKQKSVVFHVENMKLVYLLVWMKFRNILTVLNTAFCF